MRHARKAQGRRIPHILLITVLVVMICVGSVVTVMANTVEITDVETAAKLMKLIDALEDNDDVNNVYANYEISDEIMAQL